MSNYELNNHKKSDAAKWWLTLVGFILTGVILVGMMFGIITPVQMEGKNPTTAEQTETVSGSQILTRPMLFHGVKLYAAEKPTTAPEGSVTLNATLDASGTIYNDDIGWEYAFQNPTSTWASGKKLSDYMTFTVSEDTHSATFTCKAAFGEPIIVTAKSEENPECTATCQLDYVKRITAVSDAYPNASSASFSRYIRIGMTNTVTADVTYGVGTVTPYIDILDIKVEYSKELISVITSNVSSGMFAKTSNTQIVTCTPKQGSSVTGSFNSSLTDFYGGGGDPNNLNNAFYNNAYNAETGEGSSYCDVKPTIKIAVTYGDVTYQTFSWTAQGSVRLEKGALKLKTTVTSVKIDNSNVVF